MDIALDVKNLTCTFPEEKGISDVSFQLKKGDIYFVYGGRGAGKTILLQTLIGAVLPKSGIVKMFGSVDYLLEKSRFGYVPQKPYFIEKMTIKDLLHYFCLLFGTLENEFEKILDIDLHEKKAINKLPLHVKRIVNLGIALLGNPDLVLLDEPFDGLDVQECEHLISIILFLNGSKNISFLLTGQNYELASQVSTKYGVLNKGKMVAEFTHESLIEQCERCIKIRTPQLLEAIPILQKEFAQYEVLSDDLIRIFCPLHYSSKINEQLVHAGIDVSEVWIAGMNPQEYLSNLAGGIIDHD